MNEELNNYEKGEILGEQILIILKNQDSKFVDGYLDKVNDWLLERYEVNR